MGGQIITFAMSAHRQNCGLQVKACRALRNFADNNAANQIRIAGARSSSLLFFLSSWFLHSRSQAHDDAHPRPIPYPPNLPA
jgi:hypothetical protein